MIGDELHHIGSSTTSHLLFDSSANPGSCSNVVGEHLPPKRSGIPSTPIDMALSSESHRDSIGVSSHQPQPVKRLQRQGQREQSETVPITISSLGRISIIEVVCGNTHLLLLSNSADVYAFGIGRSGQLGLGVERLFVTKPEKVPHLPHIKQIAAGANHSVALSSDKVKCLSYIITLSLQRRILVTCRSFLRIDSLLLFSDWRSLCLG